MDDSRGLSLHCNPASQFIGRMSDRSNRSIHLQQEFLHGCTLEVADSGAEHSYKKNLHDLKEHYEKREIMLRQEITALQCELADARDMASQEGLYTRMRRQSAWSTPEEPNLRKMVIHTLRESVNHMQGLITVIEKEKEKNKQLVSELEQYKETKSMTEGGLPPRHSIYNQPNTNGEIHQASFNTGGNPLPESEISRLSCEPSQLATLSKLEIHQNSLGPQLESQLLKFPSSFPAKFSIPNRSIIQGASTHGAQSFIVSNANSLLATGIPSTREGCRSSHKPSHALSGFEANQRMSQTRETDLQDHPKQVWGF